jgi:long-chain acyl-CoA synthetase
MERPGTVGRARRGRRLLVDPGGEGVRSPADPLPGAGDGPADTPTVADDGVGTVWCAAPPFARFSYWGDEAATRAAWRGDAFTVGDLGRLDGDGYLFLSGRRSDLIITGGVNVYPAEVEAALLEVDGVDEVAVFGRPDPEWGEQVCAAYVGAGWLTPEVLAAAASGLLASYKRPKQYVRTGALPRTPTGKLLRRAVAARLGLEGAAEGMGGRRPPSS